LQDADPEFLALEPFDARNFGTLQPSLFDSAEAA
jgi:hypothetical protein